MISRADIEAAWQRIEPYVRVTPTMALEAGAFAGALGLDAEIYLKLELLQVTGSFKPRGAFNRILSNPVPDSGVIAASGGNHGLATAYAARRLGHRAEIFVPTISSPVKQQRLREYGARLDVIGERYAEAYAAAMKRAAETGALYVHAYNQPETLAGQGTCGRELDLQVPDLDTVLVAVGGGGFIAGIAAWFGGASHEANRAPRRVKVIGVEPEASCCLAAAMRAGEPVDVSVSGVAADSLGASRIGDLAWEVCRQHVADAVVVSDAAIVEAQRRLWDEVRLVAEPGGATALAALLSGAYRPAKGERVAVLVCGSNANLSAFTLSRSS